MRKRQSNKNDNAPNGTIVVPFEAFENRIRKVIHEQDIMIDFNQEQLERLYNKVLLFVETSIFAEMEQVMNAI